MEKDMEGKEMTRKGFMAAAAVGAASLLIPKKAASAAEAEDETKGIASLGAEVDHDASSLEGTTWEAIAANQTEVVKSYNGLHIMNAPGYWAFTGWEPEYDHPTDRGFGYSDDGVGGRFMVMAEKFEYNGGDPFKHSTEGALTGQTWIDGRLIYRKVISTGSFSNATGGQTTKDVAHGISGLRDVVKVYGVAKTDAWGITVALPRSVTAPGAGNGIDLMVGASAVTLAIGPGNSFDSSYVTVEYTRY